MVNGFCGEWWSIGSVKTEHYLWPLQIKNKMKSECDLENEVAEFPRFIVLDSPSYLHS